MCECFYHFPRPNIWVNTSTSTYSFSTTQFSALAAIFFCRPSIRRKTMGITTPPTKSFAGTSKMIKEDKDFLPSCQKPYRFN